MCRESASRLAAGTAGILLVLLTLPLSDLSASDTDTEDPWRAFRPLLGRWEGVGTGFGSVSDVTHEWSFAIDGKFLQLRTRSVTRADDGQGEVHEDIAFLSHDTDHDTFVFRQFLSEGFVNTYDVKIDPADGAVLLFAFRECESAGGMRAQLRLTFASAEEYAMALDLASSPDGEFRPCQDMKMRKVR